MASTAIQDAEMIKELYDADDVLAEKVDALAEMVRSSRHFVAFTGAGISTSAGIPDFRGPDGKWTREAKGMEPLKGVSIVDAFPTQTHMAFVELYNRGVLKYLISQNCDGLHRRSGLPASAISELHGNCWVEICEDCGQQHFRDFKCMRIVREGGVKCPTDHFTGRFCSCGGRLLNSTIDFGQDLPHKPLERAEQHSRQADLHLACGSSLRVTPACDQPKNTSKKGGKLVIVNLQKTPLTAMADMQIYAKTDTVMEMLMDRLTLPIPEFRLQRRIILGRSESGGKVYAKAVDVYDPTLDVDHLRAVDWNGKGALANASRHAIHQHKAGSDVRTFTPKLHFVGHYQEPPLDLKINLPTGNAPAVDAMLSFNPFDGEWTILSQRDVPDGKLQPPMDAVEARIPDYGKSHRKYCIDKVIDFKHCDSQTAQDIVKKRFESAKTEALAKPTPR